MRKILCALVLCVGMIEAKDSSVLNENIVQLIHKQTKKHVKVLRSQSLKSNKDFQIVVVEESETKYHVPLLANKNGTLVVGLSNLFFSNNEQDIKLINSIYNQTQSYNFKQANGAKINAMFDALPKDYIITLASKNKNAKELYIVSDPMCPHCQNELRKIQDHLKDANVHMVVVGLLGRKSILKAADIMMQAKQAHNTESKIALLNKVYATAYEPAEVPDDKIKQVEEVTKQVLATGIESVPFIYERQQ
ncbi:disulfide isomerase [Helicobacter baculiformis]|uniref:Disulfide isomerase n=1 Tax=Helicobacter baculiformis TaxID=427351 RepID=A0ABV7ZJJ4_9HELI|nr:disulfide isomerase [Helicobacter baculiformis]